MRTDARVFLAVADALAYPEDESSSQLLAGAVDALSDGEPALASAVRHIACALERDGLEAMQELYTQSFDLNPAATLDIGWHLFGESYKRGAFLVGLRQDMRESALEEGTELPDHLPYVLRLLARLPADEHADLLLRACVVPALISVLRTLRGKEEHPYVPILEAAAERFGPPIELAKRPSLPVVNDGGDALEEAAHG